MTRDANREACPICGKLAGDDDRRVLVNGKGRRSYCSQSCLRTGVRVLRMAQRRARLRGAVIALTIAIALVGAGYVRHRMRLPRPPRAPVATAPVAAQAPAEPTPFGPHWPPTDDEWREQFAQATWVHPLPGPARRRVVSSGELVVAEPAGSVRARCRTTGRCGVDLGGELWGEHVYAAHDGVIDRLQRSDDAPGGVFVRIAHWSGAVFTQYFHLAAVPTRLAVGTRVNAGDVIGLLGDTGLLHARAHLHFALSVRPSTALPEVYWDPEPLMAQWPLRTPERGSVAGLVSLDAPVERIAGPSTGANALSRPAHRRSR